jgi:hypothetical protein
MEKCSMEIRIIKREKVWDYTFIDDALNVDKPKEKESALKKEKSEAVFRLREDAKTDKLKHKSKAIGGHSMQGHSPVYE